MNSFAIAGASLAPVCKSSSTRPAGGPSGSKTGWERAVFAFLGALALLFALGPQAAAAADSSFYPGTGDPAAGGGLFSGPALKIIYAAESRGEVRPCFY